MERILFPQTYIEAFDWLTSQKVVEDYEMICDWLANQECLFPGESSIKVDVLRVKREKRSDVHTKNKRIRKEIFPRTKASPAKDSLSKKLSKIERLHQPDISFVCVSTTTKKDHFYKYIYCVCITIAPLCFIVVNC